MIVESAPVEAAMRSWIQRRPLVAYFGLAYVVTWSFLAPLALAARGVGHWSLPSAWHALGALGPFTAALIVTAVLGGRPAVRGWLAGFAHWRIGMRWWLVAAVSPFALFLVSAALVRLGGAPWPDFATLTSPAYANPTWLLDVLFVGTLAYGVGEEPGWRGFALPRLEKRHGPLAATLILVPLWALWHAPAFFYRPSYQGGLPTVIGFLFGLLAGAIVLTFLYDGSRGSILAVVVFHILINIVMQVASVVSQPVVAVMNVLIAVAAVAIVVFWIVRTRRGRAVGEVAMQFA